MILGLSFIAHSSVLIVADQKEAEDAGKGKVPRRAPDLPAGDNVQGNPEGEGRLFSAQQGSQDVRDFNPRDEGG